MTKRDDPNTLQKRREELVGLFDTAPIKHLLGMSFSYQNDSAAFVLPYNPDLNHALGDVHGGIISTLIDNAGWFTAAAYYDTWLATVDLSIRLLEPARHNDLEARGKLVRRGARLAITDMEVRTPQGLLIAAGNGTFLVSDTPFTATAPFKSTPQLS